VNGRIFFVLVSSLVGCAAPSEPEPRFVPASGSISDESRAMTEAHTFAITRERCDRERRCRNLGRGKTFESRNACERFYNDRDFEAFGPGVCRTGIDQNGLSECLRSIRAEACASSLDTLETLDTCQPEHVCL